MSAGGFSATVTDFAAESPEFTAAGDDLSDATKKASSTLDGLDAFWGTTAHGPDFGEMYQDYQTKVLALASACGIALHGIGDGLDGMGKKYGITEAQITKALQGPLGEIQGPKEKGQGAD